MVVWNVNKIAESNDYKDSVDLVDAKSKKDFDDFKNYYESSTEEKKNALNEKFKTYMNEELKNDPKLKDKINGSETEESAEISEQDIADLNTVRNLTDVFNSYPNISSPEHRAIKKMVDEYIKDLNRTAQEVLSNTEDKEWKKIDNHK